MTLYEYTCYDLTGYRNTGREVRAKDTHDLLTFRRARGTGELVKSAKNLLYANGLVKETNKYNIP